MFEADERQQRRKTPGSTPVGQQGESADSPNLDSWPLERRLERRGLSWPCASLRQFPIIYWLLHLRGPDARNAIIDRIQESGSEKYCSTGDKVKMEDLARERTRRSDLLSGRGLSLSRFSATKINWVDPPNSWKAQMFSSMTSQSLVCPSKAKGTSARHESGQGAGGGLLPICGIITSLYTNLQRNHSTTTHNVTTTTVSSPWNALKIPILHISYLWLRWPLQFINVSPNVNE